MSLELGNVVIGWREALVGLIALVALYMLVMAWRMRRLQKIPPATARSEPLEAPAKLPEPAPAVLKEEDDWQATRARLAQETFMRGMEEGLAQLRDEMDVLRDEVDALRGEVAALRDEMGQQAGLMRASQTVSPLYNDAMRMAQVGHDAATIAERCGIARAEAELVVALVKSQNN